MEDNIGQDCDIMRKWFRDYARSWRALLKHSDEELGLALPGGVSQGYRATLTMRLEEWAKEMNGILASFDGCFPDKVRINMFKEEDDDDEEEDLEDLEEEEEEEEKEEKDDSDVSNDM